MAPITWREVSSPNFSSVNDAYRMSNTAMNRAVDNIQKVLGGYENRVRDENSNRLMLNALQYQDSASAADALRNGTMLQGVDPRYLTPEAINYANRQHAGALRNEGSLLQNQSQGLANQSAEYDFGRTQLKDQRADLARELTPQANDVLLRVAQLQESGNSEAASQLMRDNLPLLQQAGYDRDKIIQFNDDYFTRSGNQRRDTAGRQEAYQRDRNFDDTQRGRALAESAIQIGVDLEQQKAAIDAADATPEQKRIAKALLETYDPAVNVTLTERQRQDLLDGIPTMPVAPATDEGYTGYTARTAINTPTVQEQQQIDNSNAARSRLSDMVTEIVPERYQNSIQTSATPVGDNAARATQLMNNASLGSQGAGILPTSFNSAITRTESGNAGDYDTLYGHAQRGNSPFAGVRVSEMTVGQAINFAEDGPYGRWVKSRNPQGAYATPMGKFQIVGSTLKDAARQMGLDPNTRFSPEVQESIALFLAQRAVSGKSDDAAVRAIRNTWEGFKSLPHNEVLQVVNDIRNSPSINASNGLSGSRNTQLPENVPVPSQRPEQLLLNEAVSNAGDDSISDLSSSSRRRNASDNIPTYIQNVAEDLDSGGNRIPSTASRILTGVLSDTDEPEQIAEAPQNVQPTSSTSNVVNPVPSSAVNPEVANRAAKVATAVGRNTRYETALNAASSDPVLGPQVSTYLQERQKAFGTENDPRRKDALTYERELVDNPAFSENKTGVREGRRNLINALQSEGIRLDDDIINNIILNSPLGNRHPIRDMFGGIRRSLWNDTNAGVPFDVTSAMEKARSIATVDNKAVGSMAMEDRRASAGTDVEAIQKQLADSHASVLNYQQSLSVERNKANPSPERIRSLEEAIARERQRIAAIESRFERVRQTNSLTNSNRVPTGI